MVESVEYLRAAPPVYPKESQRRREHGTVVLRVLVDAQGRPAQIQVERSSGYERLDIAAREADKVAVYCPLPRNDRPCAREAAGLAAWRTRMQSQEGKACYARRRTCERPHADMRNRGLRQFLVRGRDKVKAVALWFAHAHNLFVWKRLLATAA